METDSQSTAAAAAAEPKSTHSGERKSLLSVKQDFSRLSAELSEMNDSVVSAVSECEESVEADTDVSTAVNIPPGDTADKTELALELNSVDETQSECLDKHERDTSCDATSKRHASPDEPYQSPSSYGEGGPQPDTFSIKSASDHEPVVHSDQLAWSKSKKATMKRKSAQHETSAENRSTSPVVKKARHKTELSPQQHVRTSSGIFVVQEVTQPGKTLQTLSYISVRDLFKNLMCHIAHVCM